MREGLRWTHSEHKGNGAVGTRIEKAHAGTCPLLPYLSGKVRTLGFG